ncbi:N-acetylglucosaminyl-phosphatidylinositol de-N-acetylase [Puccinia graminis f. sp. tritici]|uniref:N-acetylglucosaminylphosphatidylinositol deacetylase n=1 Tax=Puccinia graminis f. sp. tritici TaxID=56615 RepID=A0A5B0LW34_PUCGR|nr:N-acetylglucosaminyl-phosphatidylinositol de-N-acetylase [Puccinia graminis f. sp. tritici]KAA1093448.1 N-acetylglucosaminyl-phosphatidylinositol de-N-acetylase [Puccinia graminis f. sp. tritici]
MARPLWSPRGTVSDGRKSASSKQKKRKMHQQHLYHRTTNKPGQHQEQEGPSLTRAKGEKAEASYDEKKTDDRRNVSSRTYPKTSASWTVKSTLQCLIGSYIIFSLSVYVVVVLVWKQESSGPLDDPSIGTESAAFDPEWWASPNVTRAERILLVIAHPDDESLFFSPTLLNLLSPRHLNRTTPTTATLNASSSTHPHHSQSPKNTTSENVPLTLDSPRAHILSLSSGNAEGLGIKRTREMRASCWAFGIPSTSCIVLDHPSLPDSMSVWWPEDTINEFVKLYVDLWNIDLIITFDHHGVSGHTNHRAIASALSRLVHTDPKFPTTMMLRSPGLIEKYSSLFWMPYTLYRHHRTLSQDTQKTSSTDPIRKRRPSDSRLSSHNTLLISTPGQYWEARRAFNQHVSQLAWFRRLWLLSSRLMWINELARVVPIDHRFVDHPAFRSPSQAEQILFPVKSKLNPTPASSGEEVGEENQKVEARLVLRTDDDRHPSSPLGSNKPHGDSPSDPH